MKLKKQDGESPFAVLTKGLNAKAKTRDGGKSNRDSSVA